jgi:hypothetical protein
LLIFRNYAFKVIFLDKGFCFKGYFQLLISRVWVLRVAIQKKKLGFGFRDFSFGIDL